MEGKVRLGSQMKGNALQNTLLSHVMILHCVINVPSQSFTVIRLFCNVLNFPPPLYRKYCMAKIHIHIHAIFEKQQIKVKQS